ncbi:hypothetical protein NC653_023797 [Populus alba x Populus x berolinensis]|nr:hypothetical protein NC653_023797 [Populus alba x Populus x berolinensis]
MYMQVTGAVQPQNSKISTLVNQVSRLQKKFADCKPSLVACSDVKFAFRFAKDAIVSQITWPAENSKGKRKLKETCVICYEDTDVDHIFSVDGCFHRYCFPCMKQHVEVKLLQGTTAKCPHEGCKSEVSIETCGEFLDPKLVDIMSQRKKEASIAVTEKVYCPYPRCSALMSKSEVLEYTNSSFVGGEKSGARKCVKCHYFFCINCRVPWHYNMTCYDYKRSKPYPRREDKMLDSLAKRKLWRQCVMCKNMVELAEGCYHITCSKQVVVVVIKNTGRKLASWTQSSAQWIRLNTDGAITGCMEEKNMIVSDQTPFIITTKDHDPAGNQVVHKVATGGSDHTLEPNNLGGGGTGCSGGSGSESVVENTLKRKRGRPRKDDVGANLVSSPPLSPPPGLSSSLSSCEKRVRGRPRGSGKLQLLASLGGFAAETAGGSFTPHVVPVHTGEDIVTKLLAFSQKGARAVCILSATGVVSSVIMRQPGSSGGILRYVGPFEILSLSGSFTSSETGGSNRKIGMLSISLAKPDGRVFGGGVAGSLIAAGPIQLIIASFKQNIGKEIKRRQSADPPTAPSLLASSDMVRVPAQIAGTTGAEDNCTTPTSALSEPRNEEAGSTVISNQQANASSQNSSGQNVLQSQQHIPDQTVPPDANVGDPWL